MSDLRVVIAAAGRGSRAGLPYPKTLYPVNGVPILLRILELLMPYDANPTVVVSPIGEAPIRDCLTCAGFAAHLVMQPAANGMGDAVLRFANSPAFEIAEHLLLVWGDIPLIQPETVKVLVHTHFGNANDFTFATRQVDSAYTVVKRDPIGRVMGVVETRELGLDHQQPGERDIGLFVFRKDVTLTALSEDLSGKFGKSTGEHGFLYVIEHLAKRGLRVEALTIATELDLISLNRLEDLAGICAESLK
jgi:bifunctional UDP-N-acetylglucosamine pyrophosphorylase/glucosamine-1-phosphate N-acetyltransferase